MNNQALLSKLTAVFAEEFDNPALELKENDTTDTVDGWDSLAHVRIIAALEGELGIMFDVSEIEESMSVEKLLAAIRRHLA